MSTFFLFLAGAACFATVLVLGTGIAGFGSGRMSSQRQNKMMQLRVLAQGVAVVLLVLMALTAAG